MGSHSGGSKINNHTLMKKSLSHQERFIYDQYAESNMPKEKVAFSKRWNWKPCGEEGSLNLGKISLKDQLANLKWSSGVMAESEIHIIYLPHLPLENFRKYNIMLSLNFNGATDDEERLLAKVEFPVSLHMHIIFFPGHSFSLSRGSTYPWSLEMITNAPIEQDYIIADAYVQFKAYHAPLSYYTEKRGANLISLVPIDEAPTGIITTRPRNGQWKIHGLQFGMKQGNDTKIIQRLQEATVDIEALQNLGILMIVLKQFKKFLPKICDLSQDDANNAIRLEIFRMLKGLKSQK